ncbi:MAG: serine/threonine protein kinase [Labilithrix sp.]|nr:serine/threonine protein kinase [Labilithrix sp.]MCW5812144.1 serine/threonine protein kinase [Labilithrix sp.]
MAQKEDRRLHTIIGGKWRVDALLGSGSMASVYAVTHRNGAKAALKILHPTLCTDPKVCERFLGEGYLTNQVKHSAIVRVLDDGMTDDGCVFLVMDLLDGKTLEALRQERGGRIDVAEALDVADALMDALHAVHAAGIVHRDLKPQNVFVCEDGDVKLLDFGVARVLETSKSRNKMSLFGMVLGTPSFMSPEQAVGARDEIDHRADIYSLGATLFTALTGETVHLGPHVQAKLLAAGTVQARSISLVKQDLHPALVNVIDTALRFDKADRWQSVDAFRRALRDARRAAGLGDAAPVSMRAAPARRTLPFPAPEPLSEHPEGHTGAAAALPVAIARAPIAGVSEDELDDEAPADASYPAVGGTVRFEDTNALMSQLAPKRAGTSLWLVSFAMLAGAIGLIAFFASESSSSEARAHDRSHDEPALVPATLTSAVADPLPAPVPASTGMVIGDPLPEAREAGARPISAIAPPPAWHPPRSSARNPPPPLPSPAPASPEPPPASTPAAPASSDPFSTPE